MMVVFIRVIRILFAVVVMAIILIIVILIVETMALDGIIPFLC